MIAGNRRVAPLAAVIALGMVGPSCTSGDPGSGEEVLNHPPGHLVTYLALPDGGISAEFFPLMIDLEVLAADLHPDVATLFESLPLSIHANVLGEFYVFSRKLWDGDLAQIEEASDRLEGASGVGGSGSSQSCPKSDPGMDDAISELGDFDVGEEEVVDGWASTSELARSIQEGGLSEVFSVDGAGGVLSHDPSELASNGRVLSAESLQSGGGDRGDQAGEVLAERLVYDALGKAAEVVLGRGAALTGTLVEGHLKANKAFMRGFNAKKVQREAEQMGGDPASKHRKAYLEADHALDKAEADYEAAKGAFETAKRKVDKAKAELDKDPNNPEKQAAVDKAKKAAEAAAATLEAKKAAVNKAKRDKAAILEDAKKEAEENSTTVPIEPEFDPSFLFTDPFTAALRRVLAEHRIFLTRDDAENWVRGQDRDDNPFVTPAPDYQEPPAVTSHDVIAGINSNLPIVPPPADPFQEWNSLSICGLTIKAEPTAEDLDGDPCIAAICLEDPLEVPPFGPRGEDPVNPLPGPLPEDPASEPLGAF